MKNSLGKIERLKKKKHFEMLFKNGNSVAKFPLRIVWQFVDFEDSAPIKCGFSVPKKLFKNAPDRNLLKRRMREAYRTQNLALKSMLKQKNKSALLLFIYTKPKIQDFSTIEKSIINLLNKIEVEIEND